MKKVVLILSTILLLLFTTSIALATSNNISTKRNMPPQSPSKYKELSELPKDYLPEEAIKNGDVVSLHHLNYNVDILDSFIAEYKKGILEPNKIVRITQYTVEGAPIIEDLIFTNNTIILKKDRSRDFYLSADTLPIQEYELKKYILK